MKLELEVITSDLYNIFFFQSWSFAKENEKKLQE